MNIISMAEIQKKAEEHFFDQDWKRFFLSRYPQGGIQAGNKIFFVTSEKFVALTFNDSKPRRFSIRALDTVTGKVNTVGVFQQYTNKDQANRAMRKLAEAEEKGE